MLRVPGQIQIGGLTIAKYINRELSWLSFNDRIMQEAEDATVPLLERLKFLGIYSSNLDEFYSVRVAKLKRRIASGKRSSNFLGGTPEEIYELVTDKAMVLGGDFDTTLENTLEELRGEGVVVVNERELDEKQQKYLDKYFAQKVRPRLVPIMLENVDGFPFLQNLLIYLTIVLKKKGDLSDRKYALLEVPEDVLPRFVRIPGSGDKVFVIILDDIIRHGLGDLFSMFDYNDFSAYSIKMTRDSELDMEADITTGFFERALHSLSTRDHGPPVRFVYDREMPEDLLSYIVEKIGLSPDVLIPGARYQNNRYMIDFPDLGARYGKLRDRNPEPLEHPILRSFNSIFRALEKRDVLLHYPYQSFQYTVDLLREAAVDKYVTSIKMTLYRVAEDSEIVNALINAIRNGKKVTVFVEIRASFDEAANIGWMDELAREGAIVIREIPEVKVHSKLILITRKKDCRTERYTCIGTGNFSESTARIYTDHALFTADPAITGEVRDIFKSLQNNKKRFKYKHLLVSPIRMEKKLLKLIKNEIDNAREGKDAYIHAKLNGLSYQKLIDALYRAGQSGVEVKMVIRGVCCLLPGVKGLSENIEVLSIVDKYLEHSRIYIFCNDNQPLVYISSADWMHRNIEKRVEVGTPVYDEGLKRELFDYFNIQVEDNVKARVINAAQDNSRRNAGGCRKVRAQVDIYRYLRDKLQ
ncbi:MAG: polyphosphate kinase 1 [Actinomycetota bacterium]|nr:polyphosphate kinase 1 [Actinomycetota bacterium]